ncbi:MAG: CRISPR-associated endonuclease Cas1 [Polyangiaceae bacterium]|nr:CRISPR-associated endonuclease Cas1 [Polyangiaceae bacterium]
MSQSGAPGAKETEPEVVADESELERFEPDGEAGRPKRLPLALPRATPPDLVPARMLNEVVYCERLAVLEWAQTEFADNFFTVEGRAVHKRADAGGRALGRRRKSARGADGDERCDGEQKEDGAPDDAPEGTPDAQAPADGFASDRPYTARSVWLSSPRLGITAKVDVIDVAGGERTVVPIEYKRGKRPDVPEGAYLPERVQLCAQVLLLREHGFECKDAQIYFAGDRARVSITIDDWLIQRTLQAAARVRELASVPQLPPPLEDSPKCNGCSLVGICLPDEVTLLAPLPESADEAGAPDAPPEVADEPFEADPWGLADPNAKATPEPLRRLHPARDDKLPLLVQEQGARIGLAGGVLQVKVKMMKVAESRLSNTSEVNVFGNVQISTPALRTLMESRVPVSFFTYGGWFVGRALGHDSKNVDLRLAQYARATDPAFCLRIAGQLVWSKILNCRTLLRRNHAKASAVVLFELTQLARKSRSVEQLDSLLGIEGTAARYYFSDFSGMFKTTEAWKLDLNGRNRRPPQDPANALLSFCYALLTKDLTVALTTAGLDPMLGFYHQPRFGRPALALDLMEEFRPLIADSTVIAAVNNGVITAGDFITSAVGVSLTPAARRKLIFAYQRRMDQLVTHPVFGYRISYRRVLEVQARLLGRLLLGEIQTYPSFRTR